MNTSEREVISIQLKIDELEEQLNEIHRNDLARSYAYPESIFREAEKRGLKAQIGLLQNVLAMFH